MRHAQGAIRSCLAWALLATVAVRGSAGAAEFHLTPSVAVSQEYNDNVNETKKNRQTDFITGITPGASMEYSSGLWDWNANYALGARVYDKGKRSDELNNNLLLSSLVKAIPDRLFLEINETYQQVNRDVTRGNISDSGTRANMVDQNVLSVSPYYVIPVADNLKTKVGYRYQDINYLGGGTFDKSAHSGFADTQYEISKRLSLESNYTFTHLVSDEEGSSYDQHSLLLGPRYEYADKSYVFVLVGPGFTKREGERTSDDLFWNVGVTHELGGDMRVSVQAVSNYDDDPQQDTLVRQRTYFGTLEKGWARTKASLILSYSEYDENSSGNNDGDKDRYSAGVTLRRELSENLTGDVGVTVERRHREDSTIDRWLPTAGLTYALSDSLSVTASYIYVNSYSPHLESDTYEINRFVVGITKRF